MAAGKILVSDYLEELTAQPAGEPSQLSLVVEERIEDWCFDNFLSMLWSACHYFVILFHGMCPFM